MKMCSAQIKLIFYLCVTFHMKIVNSDVIKLSENYTVNDKENEISERKFDTACGQIFTQKQFILESPNYPSNYPANYDCSYLIKGPLCATEFNFQFLDFNLEDSTGCTKDRLEIDSQDALCGTKSNIKNYRAPKGTLVVRFLSDGEKTGRGYRILVTRQPCPEITPTKIPDDVETKFPLTPKNTGNKCCLNDYRGKNFILVSPNFPYSMATKTDCIYEIFKSNPSVCRLRITVNFFWLGGSRNCSEGFLKINDKYICGCQSDLKLTNSFESNPITLRFNSEGFIKNSYSGFILNVIQDECPKRQVNKRFAPLVQKLSLINAYSQNSGNVFKDFYIYGDPEYDEVPAENREREETTFIDTSVIKTVLEGPQNYNQCLFWNRRQFYDLYNRFARLLRSYCPPTQSTSLPATPKNCVVLNYVGGYFKSPGYPFYYPGDTNVCYRFMKQPGFCKLRVHMRDFSLQPSENCNSDYFSIASQNSKYCGNNLQNTYATIDLTNKHYEEANFVTDSFYCGRGFFGTYEQIRCQDTIYPTEPTHPFTTTLSPPPTASAALCDKILQDEVFQLQVNDWSRSTCLFSIKKINPDICKIRLFFEHFDLICTVESLVVDGRMYCGRLTGRTIFIDLFGRNSINIMYRRSADVSGRGPRLLIRGAQILDDCPSPPAERFLQNRFGDSEETTTESITETTTLLTEDDHPSSNETQLSDICGVVKNSSLAFCESMEAQGVSCIPYKNESFFSSNQLYKVHIKKEDLIKAPEFDFEEVDCDEEV